MNLLKGFCITTEKEALQQGVIDSVDSSIESVLEKLRTIEFKDKLKVFN